MASKTVQEEIIFIFYLAFVLLTMALWSVSFEMEDFLVGSQVNVKTIILVLAVIFTIIAPSPTYFIFRELYKKESASRNIAGVILHLIHWTYVISLMIGFIVFFATDEQDTRSIALISIFTLVFPLTFYFGLFNRIFASEKSGFSEFAALSLHIINLVHMICIGK